jgi:hypothetical protein
MCPVGLITCPIAGREEKGLSACSGMATARSGTAGSMLLREPSNSRPRNRFSGWRCETALASRTAGSGAAGGLPFARPRWRRSLTCSDYRTSANLGRDPGPSWSHRWSKMVPPCRLSHVPGRPSVACVRRPEAMSGLPACSFAKGGFQLLSSGSQVQSLPGARYMPSSGIISAPFSATLRSTSRPYRSHRCVGRRTFPGRDSIKGPDLRMPSAGMSG